VDIPYSYYLSSTHLLVCQIWRGERGKIDVSISQWRAFQISQTAQMLNQSSLRDSTTESETSIKIRGHFHSFSGLGRGWSANWLHHIKVRKESHSSVACSILADSLLREDIVAAATDLHIRTPRYSPGLKCNPRMAQVTPKLLNETTSYSLMGTTKALTWKRPPSTKLTRNKLTSIGE